MKTRTTDLTVADKQAIARGWHLSGFDQATYASFHGISPRTLRSWVQKYAPTGMPVERARQTIERAITDLQVILDQLDVCTQDEAMPAGMPEGATTRQTLPATSSESAPEVTTSLSPSKPGMPRGQEARGLPGGGISEPARKELTDLEARMKRRAAFWESLDDDE